MFEREAKRERILEALNREKRFVASCSSGQGHWGKHLEAINKNCTVFIVLEAVNRVKRLVVKRIIKEV